MIKGKVLKDDDDWSKLGLKDGMTVMMMGTAEGKELKEPNKPIKFLEDMTAVERAHALNQSEAVVIPPGLENLGNTCYMNSVVQMLKRVNELKTALKNLNGKVQPDMENMWALQGGRLMHQLEISDKPVMPMQFV
jgi:ubiquitin carboxyl-terminal hydrolase 14